MDRILGCWSWLAGTTRWSCGRLVILRGIGCFHFFGGRWGRSSRISKIAERTINKFLMLHVTGPTPPRRASLPQAGKPQTSRVPFDRASREPQGKRHSRSRTMVTGCFIGDGARLAGLIPWCGTYDRGDFSVAGLVDRWDRDPWPLRNADKLLRVLCVRVWRPALDLRA